MAPLRPGDPSTSNELVRNILLATLGSRQTRGYGRSSARHCRYRRNVHVPGRAMMTPIAPHIEAFLRENLSPPRYRPTHTRFLWVQLPAAVSSSPRQGSGSRHRRWRWNSSTRDWSAPSWSIWKTRRNAPETRNVRLAAIAFFFRFPEYRPACRARSNPSLLAIPFKRTARLVPYLVREEVQPCWTLPIRRPAMGSGIGRCCIWLCPT